MRQSVNSVFKSIFVMPYLFVFIQLLPGQEIRWKRTEVKSLELELFHSTHVINLPSAETMKQGDFEFEVSHRFIPPVNEGYDAFWGLDGPANIRLAMGYAPDDVLVLTLGRSNVTGNLDLQLKFKLWQLDDDLLPSIVTLNFGAAWNTKVSERPKNDARNFQYYAQLIYNTMIMKKLGIGIVPSYLYNSALTTEEVKYSFTMGSYLQYYVSNIWSVVFEWNPTVTGWRDSYSSVSFGIEMETGGHFFKIFGSNSDLINLSQYLAGANKKFSDGDIRLGFMITRLF